jgi:fumarylacetoacetate (FAA) hydrolase
MRFVTYSTYAKAHQPGLLVDDLVYPLPYASMLDLIEAGDEGLQRARRAQDGKGIALSAVTLHSPILRPTTLRDAYAFETHVKTANANRGREVPPEWYKFPIFYFTNPNNIFGPEDEIPYPPYTKELDYELEIAAVIGKPGRDIPAGDAPNHIFGYTIFNDWSARDIQREEMKVRLGPAKGKDFASTLGPCIITLDELADRATGRPGIYDLMMRACVNGEERSRGNFKDIYWSYGDILARASESVTLLPGDVIGSGTVGTGCLLELTKAQGPWLRKGDVVELEIERIGTLKNTVADYAASPA